MLKLRIKLMTYFIFVMKQPDCSETEEAKVFFFPIRNRSGLI